MLPAGTFLVHHVDMTVGSHEVPAIEIIGEPDPDSDRYLARSLDNEGNAEVMRVTIDDKAAVHFAGRFGHRASSPTARCTDDPMRSTLTIAEDRSSMQALSKRSETGIAGSHGWT